MALIFFNRDQFFKALTRSLMRYANFTALVTCRPNISYISYRFPDAATKTSENTDFAPFYHHNVF